MLTKSLNHSSHLSSIVGIEINKEIIIPFLCNTRTTIWYCIRNRLSFYFLFLVVTYDSIRVREISIALIAAKQCSSPPILSWIEKHKVVFKAWLVLAGDIFKIKKKVLLKREKKKTRKKDLHIFIKQGIYVFFFHGLLYFLPRSRVMSQGMLSVIFSLIHKSFLNGYLHTCMYDDLNCKR